VKSASNPEGGTGQRPTPPERRWAVLRVALGQGQIVAAVVGLVLLLALGPTWPALAAVAAAGALFVLSKLLFWRRDR
jgi:hypothetical protein